MSFRWIGLAAVFVCAGCWTSDVANAPPPPEVLKAPADPLTPADVEQFLRVVRALPPGMAAEFTSPADDSSVNQSLSGTALVQEFRARFQKLFDPRRQGAAWARDEAWMRVLADQHQRPAQFAALMRNVSCAVTRVRLQSRLDVDQLVARAKRQIDDLVAQMDRVDRLPSGQIRQEQVIERAQAAIKLGRAVALLEFAELVKQVPAESQVSVRRYSAELSPLLAASGKADPFAELQSTPQNDIQPASYETPNTRK